MAKCVPPESPAVADADPCALDEAVLHRLQRDLSAEMMPSLIAAFLAELDERVLALLEASQIGDWSSAGRHAHTLKGTAATLGATALAETADCIETAGRSGDGRSVRSAAQRLQQQARVLNLVLGERYPGTASS